MRFDIVILTREVDDGIAFPSTLGDIQKFENGWMCTVASVKNEKDLDFALAKDSELDLAIINHKKALK